MITQRLVMFRGDSRTINITSSPVDLQTAQSVRFTTRTAGDVVTWSKDIAGGITVTSASAGTIAIGGDDWTSWTTQDEPETMTWDIEVVAANGDTTTIASGTLRVLPDASR